MAVLPMQTRVSGGDFIEEAVEQCQQGEGRFTHAILNPPYKKINSNSVYRLTLRRAGIETVNLYSAFVALAVALMAPGGHVVAIVPRSFCNGPYYRPFRHFILSRASLRHIHLFDSRSQAFKDADVLQENIIIMLERGGKQGAVTITTSTDDSFLDLATHAHPFERIVFPDDPASFIHVPTSPELNVIEQSAAIRYSLDDLGIKVSTGPVVDFRMKEHLRAMPGKGTVPLLYPGHFNGQATEWPKVGSKKPNAIKRNAFKGAKYLGLENHLNVFHERKQGLPEHLARGLAVFLNTSAVDEHFRRFNGHTQVNATDLKLIKYPSRAALTALGKWAKRCPALTQALIDKQLSTLTA